MRQLGKLTAEQVERLTHPVPVTSNGLPVAWLVPLTPGERRRAELIAAGRLRPGRPQGLAGWVPLPPAEGEPTLSELLLAMRDQERT
jgi:antitoxin (DNA-binding transcriptional repressor) of toxin-antitoxin stability system